MSDGETELLQALEKCMSELVNSNIKVAKQPRSLTFCLQSNDAGHIHDGTHKAVKNRTYREYVNFDQVDLANQKIKAAATERNLCKSTQNQLERAFKTLHTVFSNTLRPQNQISSFHSTGDWGPNGPDMDRILSKCTSMSLFSTQDVDNIKRCCEALGAAPPPNKVKHLEKEYDRFNVPKTELQIEREERGLTKEDEKVKISSWRCCIVNRETYLLSTQTAKDKADRQAKKKKEAALEAARKAEKAKEAEEKKKQNEEKKVEVAEKKKESSEFKKKYEEAIKTFETTLEPTHFVEDDSQCFACLGHWSAWQDLVTPLAPELVWKQCQHCEGWMCPKCGGNGTVNRHETHCRLKQKRLAEHKEAAAAKKRPAEQEEAEEEPPKKKTKTAPKKPTAKNKAAAKNKKK